MPAEVKAGRRAGQRGAQRKHALRDIRDGPHREDQIQKVERAVHVIGEQPERAAAAELGEAVPKTALPHAAPQIGDVGDIQPVEVTGQHGAVAERRKAEQRVGGRDRAERKKKGEQNVLALPPAGRLCKGILDHEASVRMLDCTSANFG